MAFQPYVRPHAVVSQVIERTVRKEPNTIYQNQVIDQLKAVIEKKEHAYDELTYEMSKTQKELKEMKEQLELLESVMLRVGEHVVKNS